MQKIKEKATAPLQLKFHLSSYFVSDKYREDEGDASSGANETIDALIDLGYRITKFKRRTKAYDMHNCLLVPAWLDKDGETPAEQWDFNNRCNLFDSFGSISKEQITTWCDDCIRWANDDVTTYEMQDQEWIGELLCNSCTPDLIVQVDEDIDQEQGSMQGGVVWG